MWRALYAYSGKPEVADDALAEAFAQAIRRGEELRNPERWIWRVAFKIAAAELKSRQPISAAVPERPYDSAEALSVISVLARLSEKQRACLLLHHYMGYSTQEIADMLGSSAPAVRVALVRGRRRLRKLMEEAEDEGSEH